MIKTNEMNREQAVQLVRDCFFDLAAETESHDRFRPVTDQPETEIAEQCDMSLERIAELRHQITTGKFENFGISIAERLGLDTGFDIPAKLKEGIARALIEQQRLSALRLTDCLAAFLPADELFQPRHDTVIGEVNFTAMSSQAIGVTVSDTIASYIMMRGKIWRPKTLTARTWQLGYMEASLGSDTLLTNITKHDIRRFRDQIKTLRKNHGPSVSVPFLKKLTNNEMHQIAPKSAALIFDTCKAMFRWAFTEEGLIEINPADGVQLVVPASKNVMKTRRPFSQEELIRLFGSPLFTGHHSRHRRYVPGIKLVRDAKYWLPILGFYTGARLGELVQLHTRDIHLDGPIPFISMNDDNSGLAANAPRKHLKSPAAFRNVPIHPDVMELGFGDFVKVRVKSPKVPVRLFPEVDYGSDGQASTVFSKFFGRLMAKVGLPDPTLVFHSFRHAAEDAFRNSGQQQYVIDRIIGHTNNATSAGYGQGISLAVAYDAVKNMKMEASLLAVMRGT